MTEEERQDVEEALMVLVSASNPDHMPKVWAKAITPFMVRLVVVLADKQHPFHLASSWNGDSMLVAVGPHKQVPRYWIQLALQDTVLTLTTARTDETDTTPDVTINVPLHWTPAGGFAPGTLTAITKGLVEFATRMTELTRR